LNQNDGITSGLLPQSHSPRKLLAGTSLIIDIATKKIGYYARV